MPELVKPLVEEAVAFASMGPDGLGVTTSWYFDPLVSTVVVDRVRSSRWSPIWCAFASGDEGPAAP